MSPEEKFMSLMVVLCAVIVAIVAVLVCGV